MSLVHRAMTRDWDRVRMVRLRALADAPRDFNTPLATAQDWDRLAWSAWIERGATFLLEGARGPAGLAAGTPHDGDPRSTFLEAVWIDPAMRGMGGAPLLVAAVAAWAEHRGAPDLWLQVRQDNARALAFYEKAGFARTGREIPGAVPGVLEVEMRRGAEDSVTQSARGEDPGDTPS